MKTDDKGWEREITEGGIEAEWKLHNGEHKVPQWFVRYVLRIAAQAERRGMDRVLGAAEGMRKLGYDGIFPANFAQVAYNKAIDDILARFNGPQGKDE